MTEPVILIVDDEPPARSELRRLLAALAPAAELREAGNGREALAQLAEHACAVMFLDIQMPGPSGLQVAEQLLARSAPPLIIFATAFDRYAVRAFKLNAIDYLLKPYEPECVQQALNKALSALQQRSLLAQRHEQLSQFFDRRKRTVERLWVEQVNGDKVLLNTAMIDWAVAREKTVYLHTGQGELRVRLTLTELAGVLPLERFLRVHRSYLVSGRKTETSVKS